MENTFSGEEGKVFEAIDRMVTAFQDKDIDGVLSSYADGAIILFEPGKATTGEASFRAAFGQAFGINPQYTFGTHQIHVTGDIATHLAPWTMRGQLPDGTVVEQQGLSSALLRKQTDGRWRIVQDNPHAQSAVAA